MIMGMAYLECQVFYVVACKFDFGLWRCTPSLTKQFPNAEFLVILTVLKSNASS